MENQNETQDNNKWTKNILNVVYAIIVICVLIWVAFYINQNKIPKINSDIKETTQSWIVEDDTNLQTDKENINSSWDIGSKTDEDTTTNTSSSWTISASGEIKTDEEKKNEEAIIKDFEKELDSLFDVIDQNAN